MSGCAGGPDETDKDAYVIRKINNVIATVSAIMCVYVVKMASKESYMFKGAEVKFVFATTKEMKMRKCQTVWTL